MPVNKYDKLELIKRHMQVVEWIIEGESTRTLLEKCYKEWGICDRTAFNYRKKALARIREIDNDSLKLKQNIHIERRLKLLRELKDVNSASGARTALRILDSIAKIDGSYIEKVDLTSGGEQITGTVIVLPENGRETK